MVEIAHSNSTIWDEFSEQHQHQSIKKHHTYNAQSVNKVHIFVHFTLVHPSKYC